MAIVAPLSRYKRSNFKIWIVALTILAAIFAYDGYLSQYEWSHRRSFYDEHMRMHAFDADVGLADDLAAGPVSQTLRATFESAKVSLSAEATVTVVEPDVRWMVNDREDDYPILKEEAKLAVYRTGPDGIMLFNRISPIAFLAGAIVFAASWWRCKDDKVVAEATELVIAGRERIAYDTIEGIDKTHFEKKGFFTIIYKPNGDAEVRRTLNARNYDNLRAILEHLIGQIT